MEEERFIPFDHKSFQKGQLMPLLKKEVLFIPIVLFICVFLYCDRMHMANDQMESRNFLTAREILTNGSWLLPTLEGKLRIAKPPLPTWITALAMKWAGTDANLIVNRIPAGICALLLALFTYLIALRISRDRGFAATTLLVLATSYQFMVSARENNWDIYAHATMAGAIWALLEAFMRKEGKNLFFLLFSLFMVVSFYSKGPVAYWGMLLTFMISYVIACGTKDLRENKWGILWGFILCVLLSALWPVYVYLNVPYAAKVVAFRESDAWFTTYIQPIWFYVTHMYYIIGIWLPLLLCGLVASFIEKDWKPEEKLFVYWFILILVSISVFPEKKIRYILPAVVPGSIVSTIVIYRLREARGWIWRLIYGVFYTVAGVLFIGAAASLVYFSAQRVPAILGAIPLAIVGVMLLYESVTRITKNAHIMTIAGVCLSIVFLLPMILQRIGPDDAQFFMHVRENSEVMSRDIYMTHIDSRKNLISYDIKWAINKKIQRLPNYFNYILTQNLKKEPYAVITTRRISPSILKGRGRLADTITTRRATYYIYLVP
jgi:4-amino-4-deoxy-L-arabinose transferase-like glycosyltransferase